MRPILIAMVAAAVLASAVTRPGSAAGDEPERPITSWMLPPATRPVWGLLDRDRAQASGPTIENADSLTGDWRGYRDRLSDKYGIALIGDYTSESAANVVGGRRQGVTYTHNVALALFANLDKLLGLEDTVFLISG